MNNSNTLEALALRCGTSVESLREIAFEHCGIPRDYNAYLVDLWLYEQLGLAASFMGPHFGIGDTEQVLRSIGFSLMPHQGTFLEKCSKSWAELVANPVARHEILLPDPIDCTSFWLAHPEIFPAHESFSAHESFGDVMSVLFTRALEQGDTTTPSPDERK